MAPEQEINEELKKYLAGNIVEIEKALQNEIPGIDWNQETNGVYKIDPDLSEKLERFESDLSIPSYCCCNGNPIWRVKLSKNPDDKFYNRYVRDFTVGQTESFGHTNQIHRGHYIAKRFEKYLVKTEHLYTKKNKVPEAVRTTHFFGKGNKCNIYYQSAESNCNSGDFLGQSYYEDMVCRYLEEEGHETESVFYEIEDIRKPGQKEVSLGRRILIIFSKEIDKKYKNVHVFIPNIYNEKVNIIEPEDE